MRHPSDVPAVVCCISMTSSVSTRIDVSLGSQAAPDVQALSLSDRRLLRMIVAPIVDKAVSKSATLEEGCALLWAHPQVRSEILVLMDLLGDRVEHVPLALANHPDVPLAVHARYTRIEILAAFGVGEGAKVAPWQTGVYWAKEAKADLLAFTLDKTSGHFSPTTRYRDYAISRDLIHWESQSVTRADSETGRRYQRHGELGSSVMLFARLRSDDRAFYFLGPASVREPRGGVADGGHVAAGARAAGRCLCGVRGGGCVTTGSSRFSLSAERTIEHTPMFLSHRGFRPDIHRRSHSNLTETGG